jgi:iron complex outermembrane receptor protein
MKKAMLLLLLGASSPALAQNTPNGDAAERAANDEIVVTAQKRSESIQDVPISIAAFSNETLAENLDRIGVYP